MARVAGDGPSGYSDAEVGTLIKALIAGAARWRGSGTPKEIRVHSARMWWANYDTGQRSTTLNKLPAAGIAALMAAVKRAADAAAKAKDARPATSYKAKSWRAQLQALHKAGPRGAEAMRRGGLSSPVSYQRGWLTGKHGVSKASIGKIAASYAKLASYRADTARDDAARAAREAADALTDAVHDGYSADVFFIDPDAITFS